MDFEWDEAKSERNRMARDLPFALAIELFDGRFIEQVDSRHDYGETRLLAIGMAGGLILALHLHRSWPGASDHQPAPGQSGESEMPIVRVRAADIDRQKLLADLAAARVRTEAEIEAEAVEDGGAWTEEELATAIVVYPPPTAEQVRALRARLGLSQAQFAHRFGFTVDTVQQYEQGRRTPSGPASTLLRVIEADPEAVMRALGPRRVRQPERVP